MSQIITKSELQAINPAINDVLGALVADGVSAWIENLTSRSWGELKTVTERYNASNVVWLRHMDVTAVSLIKTGYPQRTQTDVVNTDYNWSPDGRVVLGGYNPYRTPVNYVEITYTYGVPAEDVPYDLKMAAVGMGLAYAEWLQNSGRNVSKAQVGSYTLEFAGSLANDPTKGGTVTRDVEVVKSYALRRV